MLSQEQINQMIKEPVINDGKLECQICFEKRQHLSGECGHVYCVNCWDKLFVNKKKTSCPSCKKTVRKDKLRKVFI